MVFTCCESERVPLDKSTQGVNMTYNIVAKYRDEEAERVTANIGGDSEYLRNIQDEFLYNPNLEYIRIERSK